MAGKQESPSTSQKQVPNEDEDQLIPGFKDVSAFSEVAFRAMMGAIRSSNDLPSAGDDFDYYSSFESFRNLMDMEGTRILQTIQQIMRYHGARGNITTSSEVVELEDKYDVLVDANDQLLERIGTYLDEAAGLRKQESPLVIATMKANVPVSGSWNKKTPPRSRQSSNFRLLAAKHIQRPQARFKDKINNSSQAFVPKLPYKPNALRTLEDSLKVEDNQASSDGNEEQSFQFPHPYQAELERFTPMKSQLKVGTITEPLPLEETPVTLIDSETELRDLIKTLKSEKEIAIDLEHHQYRTYQGITCLMQLSTRQQDYLLDTLELRSELHLLNEVFTNPKIVKILHGADMDVLWLQRDLGLYLVNMFDTGQASRVLNFPRFSLAHLLMSYCSVEADKQYQLADWRIRPLPEELVKYAREDTHYLLYIYDKMRTELIERGNNQKNLLKAVLERSKEICLKRYEKVKFSPSDYMDMYKRSKKVFNSQQLSALRGLFGWRDGLARVEDESLAYVLPNHMLLQICEILPRDPQGVLACCNPIPPLVRQNLNQMHAIVREAREQPIKKAETPKPSLRPTMLQHPKYNADRFLRSPHDLSHQDKSGEVPETDVSVAAAQTSSLFKEISDLHICPVKIKKCPILSAFGHERLQAETSHHQTEAEERAAKIRNTFSNPMEKFLPDSLLEKSGVNKIKVKKDEKWKLLPHTKKPEAAMNQPKPVVTQASLSHEDMIAVATLEEEETPTKSLRQQYPKAKKRPSDGSTAEMQQKKPKETEEGGSKVKEKVKEKKFAVPQDDFVAYNYKETDYSIFDGPGQKSKKREYNPDVDQSQGKHKKINKRNAPPRISQKSMTYNQSKPGHSSKIQWPKR